MTWKEARLGELLELKYGKSLPDRVRVRSGSFAVYGSNGVVGRHDKQLSSGPTIVVGRKGSAGCVAYSPSSCWPIDTTYFVDEFGADHFPKFWYYRLSSLRLGEMEKSSAIPGLNREDAYAKVCTYPDRTDQETLARKLDKIAAKLAESQARLEAVPGILKRFRMSVLAAACSGRLTKVSEIGLTGNDAETLPESWRWAKFGELISGIRSGSSAVPQLEETPWPVLRSSSVRPMITNFDDVRFLTEEQSTNPKNFVECGDLLFTRLNGSLEYVGNCSWIKDTPPPRLQYPDRLFRAKLKTPAFAPYLELAFSSPVVRSQIEEKAKSSAGHQRISTDALTETLIPMPPLHEQAEIVRRVAQLLAQSSAIEFRFLKARAFSDKLMPSVLAKAFRGELL